MKHYRRWSLIAAAMVAGCVGTEVGNPQDGESEITVEFTAETDDPRALTLDNGIDVEVAWVAVEEVGVRETARCEDSDRFDDESPFTVNLLTGEELPRAATLTQAATDFCRLEIEFDAIGDLVPGAPHRLVNTAPT